jgi:hypothetical protein
MACFLVPLALAVVTTALAKRFPDRFRVWWLNAMLWGGSLMLAVEHVAHGEVVPYPPFLTGGDVPGEMFRVGVPMAATITAIWGGLVAASAKLIRRAEAGLKTRTGILR